MINLKKIPVLDLAPGYHKMKDEIDAAIAGVLESGQFIMGPDVKAFEAEAAQYLGVRHAVGVNSGTDALVIGLRALGVTEGDEVITTPFTFFATSEAINQVGATPVFVDIDPKTYNIDAGLLEAAITPRTKAIIPVHLYGHASDMDAIMAIAKAHNLSVLEDCAQSFGAKTAAGKQTGTVGHVGAYSFFPSKTLGAFGDGGMVATNDDQLAATIRALRVHGSKKKYFNEMIGYNSRLDTIQAAVLRVKLKHIDATNAGRRRAASRYNELLANVEGVTVPNVGPNDVFHQYTIRIEQGRDDVQKALAEAGISTMVYYPVPLHKLPVYADQNIVLPQSERAAAQVLSLPIWPEIDDETLAYVSSALRDVLEGARIS